MNNGLYQEVHKNLALKAKRVKPKGHLYTVIWQLEGR